MNHWTERELWGAEALACRVQAARYDQLECIWEKAPVQGPPPFSLDDALNRFADYIECYTVNLHPPLAVRAPVLRIEVEDDAPSDLLPYSERLRSRFQKPSQPTRVYVASRALANLFGSTAGGLPELDNRDHDVLLTDVFCHYLRHNHVKAIACWDGENARSKAGYRIKDPDVFLLDACGVPERIVESGGKYSVHQLASLIDYAAGNNPFGRELALEVW